MLFWLTLHIPSEYIWEFVAMESKGGQVVLHLSVTAVIFESSVLKENLGKKLREKKNYSIPTFKTWWSTSPPMTYTLFESSWFSTILEWNIVKLVYNQLDWPLVLPLNIVQTPTLFNMKRNSIDLFRFDVYLLKSTTREFKSFVM